MGMKKDVIKAFQAMTRENEDKMFEFLLKAEMRNEDRRKALTPTQRAEIKLQALLDGRDTEKAIERAEDVALGLED